MLVVVVLIVSACVPQQTDSKATEITPDSMAEIQQREVVGYRLNGLDGVAHVVVLVTQVTDFDWEEMLEGGGVLCANQHPSVTVKAIHPEFCGQVDTTPTYVAFGTTTITPHDVVKFEPLWTNISPLGLFGTACSVGTGWFNQNIDSSGKICLLVEEVLR